MIGGNNAASDAPATITSAAPRSIILAASPRALVPAAQAVAMAMLGPCRPWLIEMAAAGVSKSILGMKKGLIRLGPRSIKVPKPSKAEATPPTPLPRITPVRRLSSSVSCRSASARAWTAAAWASWVTRSMRRASLRPKRATGSNAFTWPPKRVLSSLVSKPVR